jgi:hypothetical protein
MTTLSNAKTVGSGHFRLLLTSTRHPLREGFIKFRPRRYRKKSRTGLIPPPSNMFSS